MKKLLGSLKTQVKSKFELVKIHWHQSDISLQNDIQELQEILECIKNKSIFQTNIGCNEIHVENQLTTYEETEKDVPIPKKRGRATKTSTVVSEPKGRSDSSDSMSLNDSVSSTSSRSRRAAAQAADQKLAQVQSLSQLKSKLRRPTNFDEKQNKAVSSPPAKCRRTRRNESAGSSSPQEQDVNGRTEGENCNVIVVKGSRRSGDKPLDVECIISVEKLNTPTIKSFTHPKSRSSRSLDRACKRESNDLFDDNSIPELNNKPALQEAPNSDPLHKTKKNKSKKNLDSGISPTEEELQQLVKGNLPAAHSSPILLEPFIDDFKGFEVSPDNNKAESKAAHLRKNTFVVSVEAEETKGLLKKIVKTESQESGSEEVELSETNVTKTKIKVLRKRNALRDANMEEKENVNRNNETHTISKPEASPIIRSRTKVLKKAVDPTVKNNENEKDNSVAVVEVNSSPEVNTRLTKTIRKHNEQHQESKSENEVTGRSLYTKSKTKKNTEEEQSDSSDNEANNIRSRTKTIKKAATNVLNSEYLISEFKDNPPSSIKNSRLPPLSPALAKGELVKRRVEDFEKMQNGSEEIEEETAVRRVTRNAMKNKVISSATDTQSSKQARNIPVAKVESSAFKLPMSSERPRMTPLGVNNRMTPASDSALKAQTNKWTTSASRPAPLETNSVTLIHKQAAEEAGKKKKEEERLKRQAKEEEAKKKKDKALKTTAEEARRKREVKLQKVAATREAAEKEKERTAARAEKEKEEKMRQIAMEREKQKEEQLKKKQLTQQKMLVHEERRRQEEAARLAKLKEQEEEHKRVLALKEREQELQKQQKAELRLAEADKNKHQGGKLGKIAAVNNAKLKMQGATSSDKTKGNQSSKSYEITPAREDRPPLMAKTENDYGIDDVHSEDSSEDESQPRKVIPAWAQPINRQRLLLVNKYVPKALWDLFMECDPCPDINQMFAGNPIKKRVRTSSAVWRTPPKYSRVAP